MGKDTNFSSFTVNLRSKITQFDRPVIMGILNISQDSFYDGGRHSDHTAMLQHAHALVEAGADIVDLGAVSTRPGAILPAEETEADILSEAVRSLRNELPDTPISVDTSRSLPARRSIESGADIINDISGGLFDPQLFETVAQLQVPYVLSHNRTTPDRMMAETHYDDLMEEIIQFLSKQLDQLYTLGVKDVWIDPGFGFAKTTEQNYTLMANLDELSNLFREPLLVGISRKSMIYKTLGCTPDEALNGTTVLNTIALMKGAQILRVHDPREAREAIQITSLVLGNKTN